ncbi:MAG TPA: dTDP-glucose 4,6-dehydratase [Clostridia bacterium]|nr:dTDP-glucose 4,6-dehydratase [Clostridia bacterium]
METVLVTGGAGFIGSRFIRLLLTKYPSITIVNLDVLTYAANLISLSEFEGNPRYTFFKADIRARSAVEAIFEAHDIECVVNFAAETHVDRSILDPDTFLSVNVLGTGVLLNAALKNWRRHDGTYKKGVRFLQVSTDEVYGTNNGEAGFQENAPLLPNNPYAASKASADMLVRAYYQTYALPVIITRSSNNFGPHQHIEKLIPLVIKACAEGKRIPVYGDGMQMRDWLYVDDNCEAIDLVLKKGNLGETYNVCSDFEMPNIEVVKRIVSLMGASETLIEYVKDRPGHDRRYTMDCTKLKRLGFQIKVPFEERLKDTIAQYLL